MVNLQVIGKNQFLKEIEEIQKIETKMIDPMALHRNEMTGEIEGEEALSNTESAVKLPVSNERKQESMASMSEIKDASPERMTESVVASPGLRRSVIGSRETQQRPNKVKVFDNNTLIEEIIEEDYDPQLFYS